MTLIQRAAVVAEARSWLGTAFRHQGRAKGVGVDCIGVVLGVGEALGLIDLSAWSAAELRPLAAYRRSPNGFQLRRGCEAALRRVGPGDWREGDILLFAWRTLPQHLGIVSDIGGATALVHCHGDVGRCIEHRIDALWRSRIVQAYAFKGVA